MAKHMAKHMAQEMAQEMASEMAQQIAQQIAPHMAQERALKPLIEVSDISFGVESEEKFKWDVVRLMKKIILPKEEWERLDKKSQRGYCVSEKGAVCLQPLDISEEKKNFSCSNSLHLGYTSLRALFEDWVASHYKQHINNGIYIISCKKYLHIPETITHMKLTYTNWGEDSLEHKTDLHTEVSDLRLKPWHIIPSNCDTSWQGMVIELPTSRNFCCLFLFQDQNCLIPIALWPRFKVTC